MKTYEPVFKVETGLSDKADLLKISGDLAWDTIELLESPIKEFEGREGRPLVVDLSDLEFIDSRGMDFLLKIRFAFKNKTVALASLPYNIEKVLERTFLLGFFNILDSVSGAENLAPEPWFN